MSKLLDLIGLGAVCAAAFLIATPLGLATAGACCLWISWSNSR